MTALPQFPYDAAATARHVMYSLLQILPLPRLRPSRNRFFAPLLLAAVVLFAVACGSDSTPTASTADDAGSGPVLTVWVHIAGLPSMPLLTEAVVLDVLQAELAKEFGPDIEVVVETSPMDFMVAISEVRDTLRAEWEVGPLEDELRELAAEDRQSGEPPSAEFLALKATYDDLYGDMQREADAMANRVGLPAGTVGLTLQLSEAYGGNTYDGERWSIVHLGFLPVYFPSPAELDGTEPAYLDYEALGYLPYSGGYDADARLEFALTYIANSAKQQVGRQFGLEPDPEGQPNQVMAVGLDLSSAEHMQRDSGFLRYTPREREIVVGGALDWMAGQ